MPRVAAPRHPITPLPARGCLRLCPAEGDPNNVGHVITTAGGSGAAKQVIRYLTERVVGNGSFGVVFQAKCIETGETVRGRHCCMELLKQQQMAQVAADKGRTRRDL